MIDSLQRRYRLLLGLSLASLLLSIYQWIGLAESRAGQSLLPHCPDGGQGCLHAWNAPLSSHIQQLSGLPVPAWGCIWALGMLVFLWKLNQKQKHRRDTQSVLRALRLNALFGSAACVVLLGYGLSLPDRCPSCLLTYLLTFSSTALLFYRLPLPHGRWRHALLHNLANYALIYLILLYPGLKTPVPEATPSGLSIANGDTLPADAPSSELAHFIQSLPPEAQEPLSVALFIYRTSPQQMDTVSAERLVYGEKQNPTHLILWTDMLCRNCAEIEHIMARISQQAPADAWNLELRHFPQDASCNPYAKASTSKGIGCDAARLLICLGHTAAQNPVRARLYGKLHPGMKEAALLQLIHTHAPSLNTKELQTCMHSPETEQHLQDDLTLAKAHYITKAPMMVVNGRKATYQPALLYSLILAHGRDDDPAYALLKLPGASAHTEKAP